MEWDQQPPEPRDMEYYSGWEPDDDYWDAQREYEASLIYEGIVSQSVERARDYLSLNGDAAWTRVSSCLVEAGELLPDHPGPALALCVTASELMIRYLVLRPLIAGLVFNSALASRLIDNPFRRRQHLDRDLLPIACQAWEIDLASFETQDGLHAWPTLLGAWKVRDDFVHKGDAVDVSHAQAAVNCSQTLIDELVMPLAKRLGLIWPKGAWSLDGRTRDPIQAEREVWGS